MAEHRDEALRLLCAHLRAAEAIAAGLLKQDAPEPEMPPDEPVLTCPYCSEKRDEKLEDTSHANEGGALVPRVTCLSCGRSFNPKGEEVAIG